MSTAVSAPDSVFKNCTFDELKVGDAASLVRIAGRDDIDLVAAISGDVNPTHLDATFATRDLFGHRVAHGMWTAVFRAALYGVALAMAGCALSLSSDIRLVDAAWAESTCL
jgi:phosphate acetyltransferase